VHDVRLILDNKSHRSKGIAYVEFREVESVPLALGLSGQRLLGVPIIVQPSHAERNRIASAAAAAALKSNTAAGGPMRLYVGSLHYNITEDMIRGIFEPFGKVIRYFNPACLQTCYYFTFDLFHVFQRSAVTS
jgi:RNA-binding protein 23/39